MLSIKLTLINRNEILKYRSILPTVRMYGSQIGVYNVEMVEEV